MNLARSPASFIAVATALALAALASAQGGVAETVSRFPDFRAVVQDAKGKVFPAVVYIRCVRETNDSGRKESQQVSGSGVVISPDGEAITNWHVIDKAENVRVLLSDGRHFDAKVVGSDKDTDLALIKIDMSKAQSDPLPYASIGDSDTLKEGDFVMAMGAPWGLNRSVSIGIVSCTGRYLEGASEYSDWIQTDAAINPGNSGGPLVNTAGEVVGLNARGMGSGDGMGFTIPSRTIMVLLPQLRQSGRVNWSWTGLQLQPLRDFNKDMYFDGTDGVIVADTDPDSPARAAGFKARDRILKVNDIPLRALTQEEIPTVHRKLGLLTKGVESSFEVRRAGTDGAPETLIVKVTPREKGDVEGKERALARFDFTLKAINQFDNPDLYFHRKEGVFVHAVKFPGNAANSGLAPNDIVLKIDGREVKSLDDASAIHKDLLAKVGAGRRVVVVVLRGGLLRQIVLDFGRDYSKE